MPNLICNPAAQEVEVLGQTPDSSGAILGIEQASRDELVAVTIKDARGQKQIFIEKGDLLTAARLLCEPT